MASLHYCPPSLIPYFFLIYGDSVDLRWSDGSIIGTAATGVLQGDPPSTLYFAIGIQPLLSRLKNKLRDIEDTNEISPYSKREGSFSSSAPVFYRWLFRYSVCCYGATAVHSVLLLTHQDSRCAVAVDRWVEQQRGESPERSSEVTGHRLTPEPPSTETEWCSGATVSSSARRHQQA